MPSWAHHSTLPAILAAIVVLVVTYGPGLSQGRVIVPADMLEAFPPWTGTVDEPEPPANGLLGDQIQQMYPWRAFAHEEFAAGRFPLLNPYAGGGVPFFANGQTALLFPLNLAVVWLDPAVAATLVQLLKPPLAALGTALFLRALGASVAASALAGLAWAFSGPMVVWLGWPHTNALLMIGYLFWTATRWLQKRSLRWWIAGVLALGVQFLGGHPETTAHTLVAVGIFVGVWSLIQAWEQAREPGGDRRTSLGRLILGLVGWIAGVGLGTALAGVQVIPTLAAVADSVTAAERGAKSLAWILLERETLLTWLVPNYFGTPLGKSFGPIEFLNYNETMGYVGAGTVILAGMSALAWRRPEWLPVFAFTLVAAGLAYGIPIITELRRLPGLGHAANTRFVFILAFGVACMAGLGLDACARSSRPWQRWLPAGLAGAGALVALTLALYPEPMTPSVAEATPILPSEATLWRQGVLAKAALLAGLWAVALGGLAFRPTRSMTAFGCVVVLALDLAVFSAGYNPMVSPQILSRVPDSVRYLHDQAQKERTLGLGPETRVIGLGEALLPNAGMLHQLVDMRVYEPVAHRRMLDYFERADPFLQEDIRSRFYLFLWRPDRDFLSLASVRWLVVPRGDPRVASDEMLAGAGLAHRFDDRVVSVWENPAVRPRAYLADTVVEVSGEHEARVRLPEIARVGGRSALVESPPDAAPIRTARFPGELRPGDVRGDVRMESWPGRTRLAVTAPEGGLLVVNDTFYPGWVATVNGASAPILWTNYLFMGIPLEPGNHTVELEYRPPAIAAGIVVSLVAALGLCGAGAVTFRRRRVKVKGR